MEKVKKVSVYILWLLLFVYLAYLESFCLNNIISIFTFTFSNDLSLCLYPDIIIEFCSSPAYTLSSFILMYIVGKFLFDLLEYIFSYKLYKGKKNWYKFFREREKKQKLENSLAWKEYCENIDKE